MKATDDRLLMAPKCFAMNWMTRQTHLKSLSRRWKTGPHRHIRDTTFTHIHPENPDNIKTRPQKRTQSRIQTPTRTRPFKHTFANAAIPQDSSHQLTYTPFHLVLLHIRPRRAVSSQCSSPLSPDSGLMPRLSQSSPGRTGTRATPLPARLSCRDPLLCPAVSGRYAAYMTRGRLFG